MYGNDVLSERLVCSTELLHHVERTCEIKAVQAVNSSPAYQLLCETLQKARVDAEAKLKRVDATQNDDAVFQSMLRKVCCIFENPPA